MFKIKAMSIICDNNIIGPEYLTDMEIAILHLKYCESHLLNLSKAKNITGIHAHEKAIIYNKTHKRLVKIRRQLSNIEKFRSTNHLK
jgi:hypothetical protein